MECRLVTLYKEYYTLYSKKDYDNTKLSQQDLEICYILSRVFNHHTSYIETSGDIQSPNNSTKQEKWLSSHCNTATTKLKDLKNEIYPCIASSIAYCLCQRDSKLCKRMARHL